jgi:foldase protein PrsA
MALMKHASVKMFCFLAVTGVGAAVVAGCGNDVPPNAVATVGDSVITQDEFDKWMNTASASQTSQGGQAVAPDPPDFKKCVAAKKKLPVPKGQKQPSDSALKKQCEQQFDQLKTTVMQFLIQSEWVLQEANAQGIKVTDKEINRTLEDQKKQAFPNEKAYQQFLKQSGMSEADILFRVKIDQLQQKLTQKITEDAKNVTDQDVQAYYDKNKKRFAQPERRDLLVVLTKTKAKAEQAKRALDNGQSWKQVVKQYSIDEASKAQGGKLPAVARGQNEKALDDAIFAARKGQVEGPVKTQFGWEVFEVTKITPASQQTLKESEETIRNLLRSQGQQKALDSFIKDFREDYKNDTDCADDFRVAECKNAPKESTETGPAPGGAPNGQAPGQPQPQAPSQQSPQP